MFENTRWSNPNYQPNFDYGQRVKAAREGMLGENTAVEGLNLLGKGIEAYAQRKRVDDILKRMYGEGGSELEQPIYSKREEVSPVVVAGGGSSVTEAGNPLLATLTQKEYDEIVKKNDEIVKKYLQQTSGMNEAPLMNFDYGVV
jgi:hypothetical protein